MRIGDGACPERSSGAQRSERDQRAVNRLHLTIGIALAVATLRQRPINKSVSGSRRDGRGNSSECQSLTTREGSALRF